MPAWQLAQETQAPASTSIRKGRVRTGGVCGASSRGITGVLLWSVKVHVKPGNISLSCNVLHFSVSQSFSLRKCLARTEQDVKLIIAFTLVSKC